MVVRPCAMLGCGPALAMTVTGGASTAGSNGVDTWDGWKLGRRTCVGSDEVRAGTPLAMGGLTENLLYVRRYVRGGPLTDDWTVSPDHLQ